MQKYGWMSLIFLGLLLSGSFAWGAKMVSLRKVRAGLPPFTVLEKATRHNDRLLATTDSKMPNATPHLVWLADSDARIQASLFYPELLYTVFPVRNFGNQFAPAAGAVDYGVNILHSPVFLITGNTDSLSLKLCRGNNSELSPELRRDLELLRQTSGQGAASESLAEESERAMVGRNVDFQVAEAVKRYQTRIDSGRLVVVGAVLDLANSYGLGANRLILININGETDPAKIRGMSHLARLDKRLKGMVGRR